MLDRMTLKKSAGFTMIELLTALAINIVVFGALITVFLANIENYRETTDANRLNQQMQTAMMVMSNEVRRAGYWADAQNDIGSTTNNNPFVASGTDISVNGANNCILFTYDHDNNGSLPAISSTIDDERYGFRLANNAIQARPPGAAFSCTAATNAWENMTDVNAIQITALTFTLTTSTIPVGPGAKSLLIRSVDISMTGRLVSDPNVTKTLTKHVRVMNDKFTDV